MNWEACLHRLRPESFGGICHHVLEGPSTRIYKMYMKHDFDLYPLDLVIPSVRGSVGIARSPLHMSFNCVLNRMSLISV